MPHDNTCQQCENEQANELHECPFVNDVQGNDPDLDEHVCNCCDACIEECTYAV